MSNRFLAVLVIFILLEQVSPQQTPQNDKVPQREKEKGLSRSPTALSLCSPRLRR